MDASMYIPAARSVREAAVEAAAPTGDTTPAASSRDFGPAADPLLWLVVLMIAWAALVQLGLRVGFDLKVG